MLTSMKNEPVVFLKGIYMKNNHFSEFEIELRDDHARVHFFILQTRPNGCSSFGEIDNSHILDGAFSYYIYDSDEWGAGDFMIQKESIRRIVDQMREFIHSPKEAVHINEEFIIDIVRKNGEFDVLFSMNDQLTEDYVTVKKHFTYKELYQSLLKPFQCITIAFP